MQKMCMKYAQEGSHGTIIVGNQSMILLMPKYSFSLYFCVCF